MPATADQLAVIRSWVGSTPDDTALDDAFDRLRTVEAVALEVLRGRLAGLTSGPAKLSVAGHMSYDNAESMKALQDSIKRLEGLVDAGTGAATFIGSARLVRIDQVR